jgi:hypothetical protein
MLPSNMRRYFTWIKLLVLLFIIILFRLVGAAVHPAGRSLKAEAKSDETQLVTAIKAFYTDYGYYPCEKSTGDDTTDYFAATGAEQGQLIDILRATNSPIVKKWNPQMTVYLDVPFAKDLNHPISGLGSDGAWYDPWGHPYLVKIDSNYNGIVLNPYSANAGDAKLKTGVIAWSLGADGKGATSSTGGGDVNTGVFYDDVLSWH